MVNAVALRGDDGGELPELFNPYPTVFDQWTGPAAAARAAGLADETHGRWRVSSRGRELAARVRREADAYLGSLAPIPQEELRRLADALGSALDAIAASPVPKDHLLRTRWALGDPSIPLVALENAVFGLWQARDDCHMSSWREAGFSGPVFDVLTRVWRNEAASEAELASKIAQQRPADVAAALAWLRSERLVRAAELAVTERGGGVRQRIEDETDRRFFEPWPDEVARHGDWLAARLRAVNEALQVATSSIS